MIRTAPLLLLALLPIGFSTARAEAPEEPTVITSNSLEMWSSDTETHAVFKKNVSVTGTDLKLTCDQLEVTATRIGDKTITVGKLDRFKHLLATGKVHIVQEDREAFCGRSEVLPRQEKIILTESPMVKDNGSGSVAIGDPLIMERGQRRVTGENVRITFPPIRDLGYDKNQPAPKAENHPTPTVPPQPTANPTPSK